MRTSSKPNLGTVPSSRRRRDAVTLVYDEPVSTTADALGVYDSAGKRVDAHDVLRPAADSMSVTIPHRLARGTYTVAWRATSADTHVVHGAFVFSVGARGAAGGIAAKLLEQERIPASVSFRSRSCDS